MQEEKNTKGKSYKYISIIGVFAIVFSLIAISSSSGTTTYLNGVIWKVINGNTIVQNNTVLNVNLGKNASTTYKLNVNGNTNLNGTSRFRGDTQFYGLHNTFDKDTYFNGNVLFTGGSYEFVEFDGDVEFTLNVTFNARVNFENDVYYNGKPMGFTPKGGIMIWGGSSSCFDNSGWLLNATGWHLCNGKNGAVDLTSRFVLGANVSLTKTIYHIGNTSGNTTKTLVTTNLPAHNHPLNGVIGVIKTISTTTQGVTVGLPTVIKTISTTTLTATDNTGSGTPFNILPPYYCLAYIQFMGY